MGTWMLGRSLKLKWNTSHWIIYFPTNQHCFVRQIRVLYWITNFIADDKQVISLLETWTLSWSWQSSCCVKGITNFVFRTLLFVIIYQYWRLRARLEELGWNLSDFVNGGNEFDSLNTKGVAKLGLHSNFLFIVIWDSWGCIILYP